jgi:hypothetical protein
MNTQKCKAIGTLTFAITIYGFFSAIVVAIIPLILRSPLVSAYLPTTTALVTDNPTQSHIEPLTSVRYNSLVS